MEPIELPIDGVLDLHTFKPSELSDLLDDYITACLAKQIYDLRIIHGKGRGVIKKKVHMILRAHKAVVSYRDAPLEAGGWGATLVKLRRQDIP